MIAEQNRMFCSRFLRREAPAEWEVMMKEQLLAKFGELFGGTDGAKVYFAPGRVNLIGEHTDYNGGHVFPCALTIGTYGVARRREDKKLRFYSMNFEQLGVIESSVEGLKPEKEADWTNYPKGVMWAFGEKGMEVTNGMDLLLFGNIPNGSGLSSSASAALWISSQSRWAKRIMRFSWILRRWNLSMRRFSWRVRSL